MRNKNSNTGIKGVSRYHINGLYYAEVVINGVRLRKGFRSIEDARIERNKYELINDAIKMVANNSNETKSLLDISNQSYEKRLHNVLRRK